MNDIEAMSLIDEIFGILPVVPFEIVLVTVLLD